MKVNPPIAKKVHKELTIHNHTRIDNYYWLNDRENLEVIDYLKAENNYYAENTKHTQGFKELLYKELRGRIKEEDESVPYRFNGYEYQTKYKEGQEYPLYTRTKLLTGAKEELMFDCNTMAEGFDYFQLSGMAVSPNNQWVAFGIDTVSRRQYHLQFKNLLTGEISKEKIDNTTGGGVWANDNKTFFYTKKNTETLRSEKIYKHILGTDASEDELVYYEEDDTFSTYVYKSQSRDYIIIGSSSTMTSKYKILEADNPNGIFRDFSPLALGIEYSIYHFKDDFYILTNKDGATNFKVMKTPKTNTSMDNWVDFIAHREDVLLEDLDLFQNFFVLSERKNGLTQIKINKWDASESYFIPINSETYVAGTYTNPEFNTNKLRFYLSEMTTPTSIYEFDMDTKEQKLLKRSEVMADDFNPNNYLSKRIWAQGRDGVKIPISMVYHKETTLSKDTPLFLYAYGSYGYTSDPSFSSSRLSLLDRGFVYAIAHVRGGEYLGRKWYDDGKMLKKKNTFNDFIDCSKHLINQNYTSPAHLYAFGGSAGGLLMGVVINEAPELYNGVIASVPFVDVVTTMLDESIPLTTGEFDEWGNPKEKDYYDYMLSYSPYDNVKKQAYPHLLVTTGLHDSQVQYWEPAKWVAKIRDFKTDDNQLFLDTDMESGHGGASGRFNYLKEIAKEYAFILDLEGKTSLN